LIKETLLSSQTSEGFIEQESLCLMAKCVGVEISQLPPQAKKIHHLCKGNMILFLGSHGGRYEVGCLLDCCIM
jgi:hypothetical protein